MGPEPECGMCARTEDTKLSSMELFSGHPWSGHRMKWKCLIMRLLLPYKHTHTNHQNNMDKINQRYCFDARTHTRLVDGPTCIHLGVVDCFRLNTNRSQSLTTLLRTNNYLHTVNRQVKNSACMTNFVKPHSTSFQHTIQS
jgi:hypothetical protein